MTGNPAAVCPLEAWLPAATMQAIAGEMNLSETAFFAPVPNSGCFGIRWFTPSREVDLIGHATLAAGHLVLERLRPDARSVRFLSGSTELIVAHKDGALALEMPALAPHPVLPPPALARGLGRQPKAVLAAKHYLCVFDAADEILGLTPDMGLIAGLDLPAVIVTAPGTKMPISSPAFLRQPTACPRIPCRVSRIFAWRPIGANAWASTTSLGASFPRAVAACVAAIWGRALSLVATP